MKIVTALFIASLAACSGLPAHVSVPGAVATDGSKAEFTRCSLGVTFTGAPRKLNPNETPDIARSLAGLPKSARWETDGLLWAGPNRAEIAACYCADAAFDSERISAIEGSFRKNKTYGGVRTIDAPFSRVALAAERTVNPGPLATRVQLHLPSAAPACFFLQVASFEPAAPLSAETFLGSTRPATLR